MEKYREKLKMESILLGIGTAVLVIVQVLAFQGVIAPSTGDAHWRDFWNGMMAGMSMGVTVLFVSGIIMNLRALKNEARLKKLYAKAHDERTAQIAAQAQSSGLRTCLILGMVATIVAGYFDPTVSKTILACIFVTSMITVGFKFYYSRKF